MLALEFPLPRAPHPKCSLRPRPASLTGLVHTQSTHRLRLYDPRSLIFYGRLSSVAITPLSSAHCFTRVSLRGNYVSPSKKNTNSDPPVRLGPIACYSSVVQDSMPNLFVTTYILHPAIRTLLEELQFGNR